jgi:hypothetical protein
MDLTQFKAYRWKSIALACVVLILIVVGGFAAWNWHENRAALAASPVTSLPSGYLPASATFLRNFDDLVSKQNKLNTQIAAFQRTIPNGYTFDPQMRAFKPVLPAPPPAPPKP